MVRIRLKRIGTKGKPKYRVVIANQKAARNGKFIEEVGTYNPLTNPSTINLDEEKIIKWVSNGAQPSEAVHNLFRQSGLLEKLKLQ
ncbi:MAG: 30S ribosomal protein S16 [Chloroflexi bacterium]|nr:30S ribosomal protein S16 [Chloroflexota bacterium]|tara:strand:+ start:983 stop:1240 length:258 start_codon:yes stop_codon:yes gene_type:complete